MAQQALSAEKLALSEKLTQALAAECAAGVKLRAAARNERARSRVVVVEAKERGGHSAVASAAKVVARERKGAQRELAESGAVRIAHAKSEADTRVAEVEAAAALEVEAAEAAVEAAEAAAEEAAEAAEAAAEAAEAAAESRVEQLEEQLAAARQEAAAARESMEEESALAVARARQEGVDEGAADREYSEMLLRRKVERAKHKAATVELARPKGRSAAQWSGLSMESARKARSRERDALEALFVGSRAWAVSDVVDVLGDLDLLPEIFKSRQITELHVAEVRKIMARFESEDVGISFGLYLHFEMSLSLDRIRDITQAASKVFEHKKNGYAPRAESRDVPEIYSAAIAGHIDTVPPHAYVFTQARDEDPALQPVGQERRGAHAASRAPTGQAGGGDQEDRGEGGREGGRERTAGLQAVYAGGAGSCQ